MKTYICYEEMLAGYSVYLLKEETLEGKEIQFKEQLYLNVEEQESNSY